MHYEVTPIFKNLYQGGAPPGGSTLKDAGFDCVVLTANDHQNASIYKDIEVVLAGGWDSDQWPIPEEYLVSWDAAANLVVERLTQGKVVLVTCMLGQNRSGLVIGMALKKMLGHQKRKEIVEHIKTRRKNALNNKHYEQYLLD